MRHTGVMRCLFLACKSHLGTANIHLPLTGYSFLKDFGLEAFLDIFAYFSPRGPKSSTISISFDNNHKWDPPGLPAVFEKIPGEVHRVLYLHVMHLEARYSL